MVSDFIGKRESLSMNLEKKKRRKKIDHALACICIKREIATYSFQFIGGICHHFSNFDHPVISSL